VQHLLHRDVGEAALPSTHHVCVGFAETAFADVTLEGVRGEQIDARESVLQLGGALEQKKQLLTGGDGGDVGTVL
jgi:hypothetical protein